MTQTKHFCDKCGTLIVEGRSLLIAKAGPIRGRKPEIDLCLGCAEDFMEFLGPEPGRKPAEAAPLAVA